MDHRDEKAPLNPEEDEHPPVAAGLPSYQEATTGQAQPPPSYLNPNSGTTGPDSTSTTWTDEKRAARAFDEASSSPSPNQSEAPLTFSISFQSSWLLQKKIHIKPTLAGGAHAHAGVRWEVDYTSKYHATMNRLVAAGPADSTSSAPAPRNVATFKYPEFIVPSMCGVTITFLPHESENPRHASPTIRFMHTTGMVTTKYALDLPVMRNRRYMWQTSYRGGDGDGQASQGDEKTRLQQQQQQQQSYMSEKGLSNDNNSRSAPHRPSYPSSSTAAATQQPFEFSNLFSDTWTPYTTQYLVDECEQTHVLAQYTRAAPWAAERGKLELFLGQNGRRADEGLLPPPDAGQRAALVEGIVVSCAAMVGMQDRLGLASSLVEAYADSYVGKGKGKAA